MAKRQTTEIIVPQTEQAEGNGRDLIIPRRRDHVQALIPAANAGPDQYPTNLPTTPRGLAARVNCEGAADHEIGDDGTLKLRLWAFIVHPRQVVDKDSGEVQWVPRIVLVQPDGSTVATHGRAVLDRLASILGHYGPGPWAGGITCMLFTRKKTTGMGYYHDLRIVVEEDVE